MLTKFTLPIRALLQTAGVVLLLAFAARSDAQLSITTGNTGRFSVTGYQDGLVFGAGGTGPTGIAFLPARDLVIDYDGLNSTLYSLPNQGYNPSPPNPADIVGTYAGTRVSGMAQIYSGAWHYYASSGHDFVEIDPATGNVLRTLAGYGGNAMVPYPPGAAAGPFSGHVFVSGTDSYNSMAIWNVDPSAWTANVFVWTSGQGPNNGIAFSPDASWFYITRGDSLYGMVFPGAGYNGSWKAYSYAGKGYAGVAVGVGNLDGYVYVNTHNGRVIEFGLPSGTNPHPGIVNVIAENGMRGDLIAADVNVACAGGDPSLLITQADRIVRVDPPGGGWFGPPTSSMLPVTTAVPSAARPVPTGVTAIAPNPARGTVRVEFALEREGPAHVGVLDVQGREVAVLADGFRSSGTHEVLWSGATSRGQAPAGIYFVRLRAGGRDFTRRVALAR